jgi:hypothetical protein
VRSNCDGKQFNLMERTIQAVANQYSEAIRSIKERTSTVVLQYSLVFEQFHERRVQSEVAKHGRHNTRHVQSVVRITAYSHGINEHIILT